MSASPRSVLASYPFRLFFLLTASYAIAIILLWAGVLTGHIGVPAGWLPLHWHSHEMLFGMTSAAIAGFILTAVCNWTGAPPLKNGGLIALAALWLAGRLVMVMGAGLPLVCIAMVDLLFLWALAIFLARLLLRYGNRKNLMLAGIIALLGVANLFMHIGALQADIRWSLAGENLALGMVTLLMVVIGGRIIPAFTRNWLRMHGGRDAEVKTCPKLEALTLATTAALIPAEPLATWLQLHWLVPTLALLAAFTNGFRLFRWRGWLTHREPLLWILHIGYAWVAAALLFKGLAGLGWVPASAWQHALGAGAMGTLILAVMTRVALGHTGRPMKLPRFAVFIYIAILVAAVLRMATALQWLPFGSGILLSVFAWALAFGAFVVIYWPILSRPRVDGRPG
ncbi:NnrS family protein [Cellvibrio polysaccharolyticus]|uniref:NnrS family protein n=1 Tax=Cellvibrio polysaccharolyticus TaxID=2082724 RepID=A0A928YVR3_9GAMM|nr:NnrS family protein [Cellvibrio polysaccharolyticus]MBE8718830.1 NnrS family protein [Cellvibrio polysaccharolyticus]